MEVFMLALAVSLGLEGVECEEGGGGNGGLTSVRVKPAC